MSLLERYKGQWTYLLSMAFAVFAFSFICYCELTGGIVYPNPRMSLMWAVALPSSAIFVRLRILTWLGLNTP